MPIWLEPYLTSSHPLFYPTLFASLFLAGNGFPISADLVLITMSYLIFRGNASYAICVLLSVSGILLGDTLMYHIGKHFGERILSKRPFRKLFPKESVDRARLSYSTYGYGMVFIARFMPGIRTVFMFTSGMMNLKYLRFIAANFAGAIIVVPTLLYSVTFVAGNQERILEILKKGQWVVLSAVVIAIIAWKVRSRKSHTKAS